MLSLAPARSARVARAGPDAPSELGCRVRLADGRVFRGALQPARHRALQLGMLHAQTAGLVELTPGTRSPDGRLEIDRRRRREHYLPGGASGQPGWLEALLEHAEQITRGRYAARIDPADEVREEVFVGVAPRSAMTPAGSSNPDAVACGGKDAVAHTRFLWVDVDRPGELGALWAFLAERPCHLLIESGGSGGVHAYWKLAEPLAARAIDARTGELVEPIERAHLRIIHRLGAAPDGTPTVADAACKERARLMRLAGSVNHKRGHWARVMEADFALAAYPVEELVGDLPDPAPSTPVRRPGRAVAHADRYKRIAPAVYAKRLAGRTPDARGFIRCPAAGHPDRHPSAHLGRDASEGWHCFACGAGGAIYDFASALLGGPTGRELRGDAFRRARELVRDVIEPPTEEKDP